MRKPAAALLILALLAAPAAGGCARVERPDQSLDQRLGYDQALRQQYQVDPDWWKAYKNAELDHLVARALERNLDLARAAVNVNRALYQAKLLGADLVPAFSGGLDASARKNIRTGGPSVRSVSGEISLSYELDLWRRVADAVSAQEWEYRATAEDLDAARLTLAGSVADGYFNLAYLGDAIESARRNLETYQAIERAVVAKYQAGKVASLEPDQARQSVLSARNTLTDFLAQRQTAEQTLRDLLNLKPNEDLGLPGPTLARQELPGLDLHIPLAVLANRPDLKAAEYRVESAFKNVEASEKAWLPSITLGAALSSTGPSFNTAWSQPVAGGTLSINLPFLDWSRVLWNLRISETDFESCRLDFEQTLTTALNEVSTYYFLYEQSRQTLTTTREKYVYDQRIANYYRDRYQAGAGELSDWLNALATLSSSRLSSLQALYQTLQYENLTYKAMAGRWMAERAATLSPTI